MRSVSDSSAERRTTAAAVRARPGRDASHATPLELLFDLTFAVAFAIAANELADYVAGRHADPFHLLLLAWTAVVLALSVVLAAAGVGG